MLVIDDDPDIRLITDLALSRLGGYEVTLAGSGPEALAVLDGAEGEGSGFDALLCDITMAPMTGLEVLEAVKTRPAHAETPFIFLTARTMDDEVAHFLNCGARGVIEKPFTPRSLVSQLQALCAEAAAQEHPGGGRRGQQREPI